MNKVLRFLLLAGFTWLATTTARAGVEVSLWHSYTPPSGETHRAFILTSYKRGLFFGSCGPSTHSLQWSYSFDMKGGGTRFNFDQVAIGDESALGSAKFQPASGEVIVDIKKKRVSIELKVSTGGIVTNFAGNGEYKFREDR